MEESKMYTDIATGRSREVDIVIEASVLGHAAVVSIECVDTNRKADVGWIERMKCKHDRLPTNSLVLMSRNGFTSAARKVAQFYNIETVAFDEMTDVKLENLIGTNGSLWWKSITLTPAKVLAKVRKADGSEISAVLENNTAVLDSNGELMGTALQLVHWISKEGGGNKKPIKRRGRFTQGI